MTSKVCFLRDYTGHFPDTDSGALEFAIYKWLRANTVDRFSAPVSSESSSPLASEGVWKERQEAEEALKKYLADMPSRYKCPALDGDLMSPFRHRRVPARSSR